MTISYVASGTLAQHTDTVTPALPAGAAAGQLAVLQVVSGHSLDNVPSTPSGWTLAGSFSGGGGTFGLNAGPRRLTFFMRVLAGGDTAPSTAIPSGSSGSMIGARVVTLARTAGTGWRWALTFGQDTVSHTAFSAACATALTFKTGDFCLLGYAWPGQTVSTTARAATASGITFNTATSHFGDAITSGNGARLTNADTSVTAGTGTQAPTVTSTLSAANTGVAGLLRIREASSDVNAVPQSVFPPRNLVSATGLTGDDIVTISLLRQAESSLQAVRAASSIDVTGQASFLRVDAEQPFGISINYAAVLTDVNGAQWTVYSGPITSTVSSDVVSDAIRGVGAAVKIESPLEWKRDRDASQFNINGRIVVVGKPRSSRSGPLTVRTETDDDGDAMNELLDQATEGTILIRKQTSLSRLDGTYSLLDDTESPNWYDEFRWFALNVVKSDDWPDVMEAAGFTLQDISNNFSILSDIAAFFPTNLLAIAQYDFGP
ncbi:hypothetical protein AB0D27_11520 [Streptomyces sp. NPDC048415]|uniref:hypothetical protein n=1 Tax=Streptomyces sp. NPDC048415 TaxID=3154822 RepID=UPI00342F40EE